MIWLSVLAALAKILAAILDMARDAQLRGAGRAARYCLDLVHVNAD